MAKRGALPEMVGRIAWETESDQYDDTRNAYQRCEIFEYAAATNPAPRRVFCYIIAHRHPMMGICAAYQRLTKRINGMHNEPAPAGFLLS